MSFFSFVAAGTVDQVRDQVRHAVHHGEDARQVEAVRSLVLGELESWPDSDRAGYIAGVLVEVTGHHDRRSQSLQITMRPLFLPKPGSDERPDEH